MYRQGDLLIVRIDSIPESALPRPDLILAQGEATGHAHRLEAGRLMAEANDDRLYLLLLEPSRIVHEEHGPIDLPSGSYRVIRQREYHDSMARTVRD